MNQKLKNDQKKQDLFSMCGDSSTTFVRKEGESIDLDNGVKVTVLNIKKDSVRLEIIHPLNMSLMKAEHSKIQYVRVH